ncbi:bifunctional riboflavin kinase/FAD synthetase [Candidatus Gillettellia adelgis]
MQLIRGIHNLHTHHHGCVLTIGNFDGVHQGHQEVLKKLKKVGRSLDLPTMVMIFEPQPLEVFKTHQVPARLMCLRDKVKYLVKAEIDYLLCVKFDAGFAANTAQAFINELLVKKLGIKLLIVGDDFHFGAGHQGDFALLQQAGEEYGFQVISITTICASGLRVSSTAIRYALNSDDLLLAGSLLGHPYSISGRVVHGNALGRTIGFPTANLPLKGLVSPVKGVYAVDVYGVQPNPLPGVANIGTRPTLSGVCQQLEVHLLDVTMDLYGNHIDVVFQRKLRNEKRFISLDALKKQIADDIVMVRQFLALKHSSHCLL